MCGMAHSCDMTHSQPRNARAFNARLSSHAHTSASHTSASVLTHSGGVKREHLRQESASDLSLQTRRRPTEGARHTWGYTERERPDRERPPSVGEHQHFSDTTMASLTHSLTWGSPSSPRYALHMQKLITHANTH